LVKGKAAPLSNTGSN
jgi:hypothetical protein